MQDILAAGIEFILWLQQHKTPALDGFFEVLTNFGGSYYLYMIPALIWCVDYRLGVRLLPIFALTLFVNTSIKEWIAQPRPFQMDARIISDGEQGFGLPSGHAQLVVVFWGEIASWVGRPAFWGFAVLVMFLMGFSRVYLGVHFPSDVIGGWGLGALTLLALLRYRVPLSEWFTGLGVEKQLGLVFAAGVFVLLFDALLVSDHDHLNQGVGGFLLGSGAGAVVANRSLHFDGRGPGWQRVLRYLIGTALMLMMLGAFRSLGVPDGFAGGLVIALELAAMGLWLTLVAPWLFQRLRLSSLPASS